MSNVVLTPAQLALTPVEAAGSLPLPLLVAYMEAKQAKPGKVTPTDVTKVTLGEYKGHPMLLISEPGKRPLNLSVNKVMQIMRNSSAIIALFREAGHIPPVKAAAVKAA